MIGFWHTAMDPYIYRMQSVDEFARKPAENKKIMQVISKYEHSNCLSEVWNFQDIIENVEIILDCEREPHSLHPELYNNPHTI